MSDDASLDEDGDADVNVQAHLAKKTSTVLPEVDLKSTNSQQKLVEQ